MNQEQIQDLVTESLDLIEINASALGDGKRRAARFLVVQAILATYLKSLEECKAKTDVMLEAQFAQAVFGAEGKNVTEKKVSASANKDYSNVKEAMGNIDAEINWIKTHLKIFDNAHLMFRQYTRE